jgi:hypothetical protein
MKSNFGNRDFEDFVRQNADQYRMFPSEDVWKNIHSTLHTRRKWYGAGLAFLLLLTAGAVTWVMITNPASEKKQQTAYTNTVSKSKNISPSVVTALQNTSVDRPGQIPGFVRQLPTATNIVNSMPALPANEKSNLEELTLPVVTSATTFQSHEQTSNDLSPKFNTGIFDELKPGRLQDVVISVPETNIETTEQKENTSSSAEENNYPLTIESVTNAYRTRNAGKRIIWQFFVTPTISYRQLSANDNSALRNALGYAPNGSTNVNKAVTHRPDLGLQIGVSAAYPLTKSLKLRGGLQFNLNRYDIKASAYNPELATINLNDANSSSISAWTNYRNYGGYRTNWLKNFYFSISAPIGIELQLAKSKKMNWGIAGTVQPTYILKDKAYLISTDYKNYAKVPWLVRRVNLSTGVETFIGFGEKTKWQIGPQVRYQLLSSFNNEYPVKEHLFDFGLKVGVFLNK